ncbi:MAG: sigma-54-dependent Fis family transcriptional regulator [Deltaproteobacteria bacterium]|nr:sigma-54-dependent Fis family transcriptional regulator [Deltaproteobacteria bacterium]
MTETPAPAVLVIDDEPASVSLVRITLGSRCTVYTATDGASGLKLLAEHPEIAVAIIDQRMPGMTGTEFIQQTIALYPDLIRIILTGYTEIDSLIEAINAGSLFRYLTKPWKKDDLRHAVKQGLEVHQLAADNRRLQAELKLSNERLRVENTMLRRDAAGRYRFEEIVGSSPALSKTLALVERVVATDTTVLILGETGTGKELIARALHYNGPRADKPFVSENCGALSPDLLTSELFGHRRGAFTGAAEDRQGLFEIAHGGTLFLDEIGDCPAELQTRLLRVLDQGEIRRVGDANPIKVDVRIVAATHRDLQQDVAAGRFRQDLYYRLRIFTVTLPPLRDRKEDIPVLAQHFLGCLQRRHGKQVLGFTPEALTQLGAHAYPGNVRELEHEVERAYTMAEAGAMISSDLLSDEVAPAESITGNNGNSLRSIVDRVEAQAIRDALTRCNGNQTQAAVELGIGRRTLIDKLWRLGIR